MVALVTGAGGFLGPYVVERLEGAGTEVVRAGRPAIEIPSPQLDTLLERSEPGLVVHCATPSSVPRSLERPADDLHGSVTVLSQLLDRLAALPRTPRLVFIGSAAVYGQPATLPVSEDHPRRPLSPYGRHRASCEDLLRAHDVPSVCLRVFSAYGEGLRRQVLWDICRRALAAGRVDLAGTGAETRDFVHARDVAAAVAAVAAKGAFEGEPYNVGTGLATPIRELAELLVAAIDRAVPISFSGRARPGDPERWQADPGRMRALGWEPAVSLRDGAAAYARWACTQLGAISGHPTAP